MDGDLMVVFSALRAASTDRNFDLFDKTGDDGDAKDDGDAIIDAELLLEGDGRIEDDERGVLDEASSNVRSPIESVEEENMSVRWSISTISSGQSL